MKTARTALLITCVAALIVVALSPALAVGASTVTATVTPKIISCSASVGGIDFGSLAPGADVTSGDFTILNDGNVTETIMVKSATTATDGTITWNLATAPNTDVFALRAGSATVSGTDAIVQAGVLTGTTCTTNLRLLMPTATAGRGTFSFVITYTATE